MMLQVNRILQLCARLDPHTKQQEQLLAVCSNFEDWNQLLAVAEQQGMGPLLYRHLTLAQITLPTTFLRGLTFLYLRHRRANALLMKHLREVLFLFDAAGIKSLVVKGAALCNSLYSEIGLRPMRDIDLLLSREDVFQADKLLQEAGFKSSSMPLPKDYYHLAPLLKNDEGMEISIELHHGLFPKLPPFYSELSFSESFENGITYQLNGIAAKTFANEEMLYHLFQHGFRPPLTYESCKLISAADIITLVEKNVATIDWQRIKDTYPQLYKSLSVFHYISPWSEDVLRYIGFEGSDIPTRGGVSYTGWPRQKFWDAVKKREVARILRDTLFPSRLWIMLYYSTGSKLLPRIWSLFVLHPVHLLRWLKISSGKR